MSDVKRILRQELPTVASVEQLRQMSPAAVFASWLEGQTFAGRARRTARG